MARRKASQAVKTARAELVIRARLLLRNTEFQKDVVRLRSQYPHSSRNTCRQFVERWRVSYSVFEQLYFQNRNLPDLGPSTVGQYEEVLDPTDALSGAVHTWDPYYDYEEHIPMDGEGGFTIEPTPGTQPNTRLSISVDLSYPLDIITAIIGSHIREAKSKHDAVYGHGQKRRPRRLNLKAVDKQLSVFDLARNGSTIDAICQKFKMKPSTVRSHYWAACYKIGIELPKFRLASPEPVPFDECPDPACRDAQKMSNGLADFGAVMSGLCETHKALLEFVGPATREYIAPDLDALEHAQARRRTGRRSPSPYDTSAE